VIFVLEEGEANRVLVQFSAGTFEALDRYVSGLATSAKVNGSRHKRVDKLLSAETRKTNGKKLSTGGCQYPNAID
jgi:hypothetical protein